MAYGVKTSPNLWVHQALHGYSDGHQQLALSAKLKPRDQKTLLVLSDSSGPGAVLNEQGYLTGYPLTQSGFFALSRTWPAKEMPRPGCVWTHTLLIDFNDLATLDSLSSLSSFFTRPMDQHSQDKYSSPMCVVPATSSELPNSASEWAKSVVAALYARPKDRIVAKCSGNWIDETVLEIWSQQWPRLRRNFRFCTLTASDRSMEGYSFDLQVLSNTQKNVRARFVGAVDAEFIQLNEENWLEDVLGDLVRPDQSGLRSFLRRIGPDVAGGREAFSNLCQLHHFLKAPSNSPDSLNEAIVLLQSEPLLKQAKSAKVFVANAAMNSLETLDAASFQYLWENLHLVDLDTLWLHAPKLGRQVLRHNPRLFSPLRDINSSERVVLERTLDTMEMDSLIKSLGVAPQLIGIALERRPGLADQPRFWSDVKRDETVFAAVAKAELQAKAIPALLHAGRTDLADITVQFFGALAVFEALCRNSDFDFSVLDGWVTEAASNVDAVAAFLSSRVQIPQIVLHSIAFTLDPGSVPNVQGSDPWLTAWRNSILPIEGKEDIYLLSYFIRRVIGGNSKSQAELLKLSFEPVHQAAATNILSEDSWRILEPGLPSLGFWFSWDRCKRIRAAVADVFVKRALSPACFAMLTLDGTTFYQLATYVAQSSKGRAYLEKVLQDLIVADSRELEHQKYIIEQVLHVQR